MPIRVEWDDAEKTVLRYDIPSQWTWEDLARGREQVFRMMDAADAQRIYAIIHFTEHKVKLPTGGLNRFRELVNFSHPKAGLTIVVGANRLMKAAAGTFQSAYTRFTGNTVDFAYTDTLEEARRRIRAIRSLG